MKKILQLSVVALTFSQFGAQILESDNFDSYTQGNIGTSTNGSIPGQGGIFTIGGANEDYKIVAIDAMHGQSLQITTDNGNSAASNRVTEKPGLSSAWNSRVPGNNIIRGSLDFYTGSNSNSSGAHNYPQSTISGSSGVIVGIFYVPSSRTLNGYANLTYTATGVTQVFNIDIPFATNLQSNTWVNVSYTYDPVNGVITYMVNGMMLSNFYIPPNLQITKNLQPVKHNLSIITAPANTVSQTAAFDNVTIEAVSSVTLSSAEVKTLGNKIDIYPNPSSDYVYISSESTVKSIDIFDLSGKKIIKNTGKDRIDVQDLIPGNYLITVETEEGRMTRKFLKK